jgi:hypothetical protein
MLQLGELCLPRSQHWQVFWVDWQKLTEQHLYREECDAPSTPWDLDGFECASLTSSGVHGLKGELGKWENGRRGHLARSAPFGLCLPWLNFC